MNAAQIIVVALLTVAATAPARADWRIDAETGALYDSNLSNSDRDSDVKDDWDWRSHLRIGNGFQLTRDLRLNLGADLTPTNGPGSMTSTMSRRAERQSCAIASDLGGKRHGYCVGDSLGYAFYNDDGSKRTSTIACASRGGFGFCERFSLEADYTFDDFDAKEEFLGFERS